jgi:hypothetical protein
MCFFFSLIPATFWLVIAYFVLFLSSRADGLMQRLGRILAIWVAVIAAFFPVMGLVVSFTDLCPITEIMAQLHAP